MKQVQLGLLRDGTKVSNFSNYIRCRFGYGNTNLTYMECGLFRLHFVKDLKNRYLNRI